MSDELEARGAAGGDSDGVVLWENQPWATDNFLLNSNSDNSAGGGDHVEGVDDKLGEKKKEKEMSTEREFEDHIVVAPSSGKKKNSKSTLDAANKTRGRRGGVMKDEEGKEEEEDDHELHIYTERERRKKMRNMFNSLHALLPHLPSKADKSIIVDEAVSYIGKLQDTLQSLQQQKKERLRSLSSSCSHSALAVYNNSIREPFLSSHAASSTNNLLAAPSSSTTANGLFNINPADFNPLDNNSLSTDLLPTEPIMFQTWTSPNVALNMCRDTAQISVCIPKKPGMFTQICCILDKYKLTMVTAQIYSDAHRSMYLILAQAKRGPDNQLLEVFPAEEIFKQAVIEINLWILSAY